MKPQVRLEEVELRLRAIALPPVDAVVAIERGGRIPGELIASIIDRPLGFLRLAYRDDSNAVQLVEPVVLHQTAVPCPAGGRVLLVDDVSASGATLRRSVLELQEFTVTTLVLKGTADIVAFPELDTCVTWPWTPWHPKATRGGTGSTSAGPVSVPASNHESGIRSGDEWPLAHAPRGQRGDRRQTCLVDRRSPALDTSSPPGWVEPSSAQEANG